MTQVTVSKRHIDDGKCGSPKRCAVALAIREHVKEGIYVCIEAGQVCFTSYTKADFSRRKLPIEASQFIERFDRMKSVEPITFELDIPQDFLAVV